MERNIITKQIQDDLKDALKARDKQRISTLRMLASALKNAEIEAREELEKDKELAVVSGYARRCRESITEFEKGGRDDLVAKEKYELDIAMTYLPEQLGADEIEAEAVKVIEEIGASGKRDMGRVMSEMMKRLKGKADGSTVKNTVSDLLGKG